MKTKAQLNETIAELEQALEQRNEDYTRCKQALEQRAAERINDHEIIRSQRELIFHMRRTLETYGVRADD